MTSERLFYTSQKIYTSPKQISGYAPGIIYFTCKEQGQLQLRVDCWHEASTFTVVRPTGTENILWEKYRKWTKHSFIHSF